MTEEALLKEIAAGNEEAFRQFYLCTVRPVHSYILSLTLLTVICRKVNYGCTLWN